MYLRILILSCNTGEGHNSAARALEEAFALKNTECDIKDAIAFWSPEKSKIISKGHVFIYRRLPKLFGVGYRFEENHPPKKGNDSLIYELVIKGCDALYEFLSENKYDAVICTHVFSAMMITELKKRHKFEISSYFVATDYTCSPGVSETVLDGYFIPHKLLCEEFMANGLSADKLIPCGIPVKQSFYAEKNPDKAKKKLGFEDGKEVVLLACGSMGCGPIKELCEQLPEKIGAKAVLTVICGNNRKLYKSITKNKLPENIRVLGYTTRMALYMDAASLILTKAGGLSSTEASAKALPMIFIDAVPGCETRNSDFFVNNGFADRGDTVEELCDKVCEYLDNTKKVEKIKTALEKEFSCRAADFICDYVMGVTNSDYDRLPQAEIE